jgi:L-cystine uptake protein TcyP (sodium:dicarboxylate symporter family)
LRLRIGIRSLITDKEASMKQIIKNFFESIAFTLIRLLFFIAILGGIYILCILHTVTNIWFGVLMFLLAIFCITIGALITYMFGLYDEEVYADAEELERLKKEQNDE